MLFFQEREARTELLRQKSRQRLAAGGFIPLKSDQKSEELDILPTDHINFFQEVEEGTAEYKKSNKEHEKEKKEEQEKYEKQIGYLTYLGQDTNEALGKKNWYDVAPDRSSFEKEEVNMKAKMKEDPLTIIKKYTSIEKTSQSSAKTNIFPIIHSSTVDKQSHSRKRKFSSDSSFSEKYKGRKKHKKHKSKKKHSKHNSDLSESDSDSDIQEIEKKRKLEVLRMERLKREQEERKKTDMLLAKVYGEDDKNKTNTAQPKVQRHVKQKYNSQFNPEIAKQNFQYCNKLKIGVIFSI